MYTVGSPLVHWFLIDEWIAYGDEVEWDDAAGNIKDFC